MGRFDRILVLLAGIVMQAAYLAITFKSPRLGSPSFLLFVGVAVVAYTCVVLRILMTHRPPSGSGLVMCLLFAAAFRVPFLTTGPGADVYRYVWDARVQRFGLNPYGVVPSDPALTAVHTDETRRINHPDLPSPYPPAAQLFFRVVFGFSERAYAFKVALALCEAVLIFVLWRWLTASGVHPGWLIAYAWNPLVILVTVGEGHLDLLGVLWLLTSILFLTNGRRLASILCFTMAVATKPLPIVLLPLYWRRVRARDAALAVVLFVALYVPYITENRLPIGSLGAFVEQFRFNQTLFTMSDALLGPRGAAFAAVAAGIAVAAALRVRARVIDAAAWAWPMATAIVMSPVVYPWYLVWLAPFLTTIATLPLLTWSLTVMSTYVVWYLTDLGRPWVVPLPVLVAEFGAVLAVSAWVLRKTRARAAASTSGQGSGQVAEQRK